MPTNDTVLIAALQETVRHLQRELEEVKKISEENADSIITLKNAIKGSSAIFAAFCLGVLGVTSFLFTYWEKVKSLAAWVGKQ